MLEYLVSSAAEVMPEFLGDSANETTTEEVATELWQMAEEYQQEAAKLGGAPAIGEPPPVWRSSQD